MERAAGAGRDRIRPGSADQRYWGTDDGTATATMTLGGTVLGRRVVADWPGLSKLYEDRHLTPTIDLDALIACAVAGHFGIDAARTIATLFSGSGGRRLVAGLIRA